MPPCFEGGASPEIEIVYCWTRLVPTSDYYLSSISLTAERTLSNSSFV